MNLPLVCEICSFCFLGGGSLYLILQFVILPQLRWGGEDKLCWTHSKRELFDVKSYYNVLVPHNSIHFPWKSIWRNKAPLRVVFFFWSAALGKILMMDSFRKQHVIMVDWCVCVRRVGHQWITIDYIVRWLMPNALCDTIFSLVGLSWIMPRRVVDIFDC
jgi:hypothetical protein